MNTFSTIMAAAWQIMNTEFTLYGFTLSYADVYLFSLLIGFVAYAIFKILWG